MFSNKKILVLSPHPDDAELGAGATLARMVEEKAEIYFATFSWCEVSIDDTAKLKQEVAKAMKELGISSNHVFSWDFPTRRYQEKRQDILEQMIKLKGDISPDIVLAPASFDNHQDHAVISQEATRAFKHSTLLGFEEPWNSYYERMNLFVALEERHLEKKIALLKHYASQDKRVFTKPEYIRSLAIVRGKQIDKKYAEGFEAIRIIQH